MGEYDKGRGVEPDDQPSEAAQPETPPTQPPPPPATPGELSKDDKTMGMLCHLLALCVFTSIPAAHVLGPLILWLVKKDEIPFVDDQGKESLNFQITATIIGIVAGVVMFLLALTGIGVCLAIPLGIGLGVAWLVFVILATIKSSAGEYYRYPINFRFIK